MNTEHFFQAETIGAHWGWIPINFALRSPIYEPEVREAMKKIRKPFEQGIGNFINKVT